MDSDDLPLSAVAELRAIADGTDRRPFVTWSHHWIVLENFGFLAIQREGQNLHNWNAMLTQKGLNALTEQLLI